MSGTGERQETSRTRHVDAAISRRFRELREALGLTRRQVAADMGASEGRWQAYESGERIPASRIWQFCSHYGLDVADLYAGLPFSIGPVDPAALPTGPTAGTTVSTTAGAIPDRNPGQTSDAISGRTPPRAGAVPAAGMAEDGTVFEAASGTPHDPASGDATMRAISEAAAELSPLERSVALAALRGMSARKLKKP